MIGTIFTLPFTEYSKREPYGDRCNFVSAGTMHGFFLDRNAPNSGTDSFTGGATQNVTGAIYFPNQNLTFNGGTTTGAKCTQLIALTLTFNGNASFNFEPDCAAVGVRGLGTSLVQLVE